MNVLGGTQEGEMQRDESLYVLHICKVVIRRNYILQYLSQLMWKPVYAKFVNQPASVQSQILGDNCIQNLHLGRYIVGYTVGNLVLRRSASGAVKRDFRTYIRQYTSSNEKFAYGYPHSNALL